jgi:hypothetical protein
MKLKELRRETAMYHNIQFRLQVQADFEIPGKARLEKIVLKPGTRMRVQIKPYVVQTALGPVEAADLFLEEGVIAHRVSYACFSFLDD